MVEYPYVFRIWNQTTSSVGRSRYVNYVSKVAYDKLAREYKALSAELNALKRKK
jgi:hypothetical protein